jgi:hypothetical protein
MISTRTRIVASWAGHTHTHGRTDRQRGRNHQSAVARVARPPQRCAYSSSRGTTRCLWKRLTTPRPWPKLAGRYRPRPRPAPRPPAAARCSGVGSALPAAELALRALAGGVTDECERGGDAEPAMPARPPAAQAHPRQPLNLCAISQAQRTGSTHPHACAHMALPLPLSTSLPLPLSQPSWLSQCSGGAGLSI